MFGVDGTDVRHMVRHGLSLQMMNPGTAGPLALNMNVCGGRFLGRRCALAQAMGTDGPLARNHYGPTGHAFRFDCATGCTRYRSVLRPETPGVFGVDSFLGRRCALAQAMGTVGPLARKRKHGRHYKGPASRTG